MASWMIHLRVAEGLIERLQIKNEKEFIVGNMAPDSGEPNEDWSFFTPSTAISHYHVKSENGLKNIDERKYIEQYFTPELWTEYAAKQREFYLGYLTHLLTDKLWVREIVEPASELFREQLQQKGGEYWWTIKADWYDMDFLYLRNHPDFKAFATYEAADGFVNSYLDFFSEKAFDNRRIYITDFYRKGSGDVVERPIYLTAEELDCFVEKAVKEICEYLEGIGYVNS